jgi:uncharacterized protein DUF6011
MTILTAHRLEIAAAGAAELTARIDALRAVLARLDESSRTFASSLLTQYDRRGSLSERQWPHVARLIERADRPPAFVVAAAGGAIEPRGGELPAAGLATLQSVFGNASRNGITPGVRANVLGRRLRIVAPSRRSAFFGRPILFVRLDDEYAGRIADGRFVARSVDGDAALAPLRALLESPLGMLADLGRASGTCCYCGRELTDPRSVTHGYGPVCASQYGLPWDAVRDAPGSVLAGARRAAASLATEPMRGCVVDRPDPTERPSIREAIARSRVLREHGPQAVANSGPCPLDQPDDEDRMFMGEAPR